MFLFTNVDLIFILSFAFIALIIIIWVLTLIIVKKYRTSHKKTIDYAAKNVHEDLEENKTEEAVISEEKEQIENSTVVISAEDEAVETEKPEVEVEEIVAEEKADESIEEPIVEEKEEEIQPEESPLEESQPEEAVEEVELNEETLEASEENTQDSIEEPEPETEEKQEENIPLNNEEIEEKVEEDNNSSESNIEAIEETPANEEAAEPVEEIKTEDPQSEAFPVEENKSEEPTEATPEANPAEKKTINAVPVKKGRTYNGKFEIFEAGDGYAYQLKASNGEILVVSEIYSSRDSVIKAIKAVQKNINDGEVKIFADKRGKYKFKLIAKNYKVLVISASYTVYKSAVRASESFKKYVMIADIVDVELDDNESKTATPIQITQTEDKMGAKIVIEKFDGEFSWALKATNGEILCQAEGYTSKAGCLYSIDTFKKNIVEGQFRCIKDKNGNYCYKLYTANNRICAVGESYPSKQSAISAANSVVSYYKNAAVEEIK